MPKGRPITVNIKDMSAQRLREYRRAASRKYYKKQRAERRLPRDFGDNRECLECKEIKPRTHEFFEQRYGDFRGECIPCRNKKQKAARIKRAFNGTLAEYEEIMRDAQCAICGTRSVRSAGPQRSSCSTIATTRGMSAASCVTTATQCWALPGMTSIRCSAQ